jgi:hypothetical protein
MRGTGADLQDNGRFTLRRFHPAVKDEDRGDQGDHARALIPASEFCAVSHAVWPTRRPGG